MTPDVADVAGYRSNPELPRLTARTVNRALRRAGIRGEIHQGSGYVYFTGPDFDGLDSTSVYVCWLNDLNLSTWIREARMMTARRQLVDW